MYNFRLHIKTNSIFNLLYHTVFLYPVPVNINYFWNFGVLALVTLVIQVITGILLAMHYTPNALFAFESVEEIVRNIPSGWLIRYLHSNGASVFFILVYLHLFRGLYFGSFFFPRDALWNIGVIILLLMIITAFLGYVLPWGQMSYWGATVITNLLEVIPLVGSDFLKWLWGGFSVTSVTLNRFFSLHYLLPFLLIGLSLLHICFLHLHGSNNPLGVESREFISFAPYFLIKDYFSFIFYGLFFSYFIFFTPNLFNHPDNYIKAMPAVTPAHIVPEWYLLSFYALLRAIPNKFLGVVGLIMGIFILILLPFFLNGLSRSARFRPLYKIIFWFILLLSGALCLLGGYVADYPFVFLGQICTFLYFFTFTIIIPQISLNEWLIFFFSRINFEYYYPRRLIFDLKMYNNLIINNDVFKYSDSILIFWEEIKFEFKSLIYYYYFNYNFLNN